VAVRVAHALGRPCVTGIKRLELAGDVLRAGREYRGAQELYEVALPAVVSVKEGINLPRYPSLPGRLRAKRAEIITVRPEWQPDGLRKAALRVPESSARRAQVLGHGTDAVPELVRVLGEIGVLPARRAGAGAGAGGDRVTP
jgi:electron transfer flavoprotein beta subunit